MIVGSVTVAEYAELKGLSQSQVRSKIRSGEIQASQSRKGAAIRIPWTEVESPQPEAVSGPSRQSEGVIGDMTVDYAVLKAFVIDLATTVATIVALWLTVPDNVATMGIGDVFVPVVVGLAGAGLVALRRFRIDKRQAP